MENQQFSPKEANIPDNLDSANSSNQLTSSKGNSILPMLAVFFIIALMVGVGGYYVGSSKSSISEEIVSYSPSPTQTAQNEIAEPSQLPGSTPIIEQTSSWETYTGDEYSFKHPQRLESDTDAAGAGAESIRFTFIGPKQIASGRLETSLFDGYTFSVTKMGLFSEKTPEEWATERRKNTSEDICGPEVKLTDVKRITVNKAVGVQYSVKNCFADHTISYVSYKNNVYEITQNYMGESADQKNYEEITNQIFDTVTFK